jgi:DNA primase
MNSNRDQIEEIKSRLDIVDVVGKYVQLKQAGKNHSGLCPFHSEKTPSFIVSPDIQRYKCFGCGESGDIFNFVQNLEHIDFPETLEKLAKEAGIELKKISTSSKYSRLEQINKEAAIYFYKALQDKRNQKAINYINERGISKESIKSFGIGYAPGGSELLTFIQRNDKYSKQELLLSGLFVEKEGKLKGKFFRRIMFPIRSSSGKVIAFTGRTLPDNDFGPKYMNSPETAIYHKSENLYSQYESRQDIRKQNLAIICEGTTDVISSHQAGIKNILAPLGTSLTKEQLLKISKLTKNVLFIFDSDKAGQAALERAFVLCQDINLNTFAANTHPYKDIDELVVKDLSQFESLIKKRVDAFTYLLTEFIKDKNLNKLEDYDKTVTWLNSILKNVTNNALLAFYVKKASTITKIELENYSTSKGKNGGRISYKKNHVPFCSREVSYIQLLLYLDRIKVPKNHDLKYFEDPNIIKILELIKEKELTRNELLEHFEDTNIKKILEDSIFTFSSSESSIDELHTLYNNIVKDFFHRKERMINVKIAIAEERGEQKESQKLLEEFYQLTKEKQKYEQNSQL